MENAYILLYILIGIISISSIYGFSNRDYLEKMLFNEGLIRYQKQFYRMLSSSFVHANYMHLLFNMFVLYQFGTAIINGQDGGPSFTMLVYFASVLGGSLLAYFMHYEEPNYRALGASGGVTGVLMSYVIFYPDAKLMLLFLPIPVAGYILIFLYMCYEVYAMIKMQDGIGHDAHLGGAITGLAITIAHIGQLNTDVLWKVALVASPLVVGLIYSIAKIQRERIE